MSLRFTASNQIAGYRGVSLAQNAFTRIVRVRVDGTQPDNRSILSVFTSAGEVHEIYTNAAADWWTLGRSYSAASIALQGPGSPRAPGVFYDVGIVGTSVLGVTKLRAYTKRADQSVAQEFELDNPSAGTIVGSFLGSPLVGFSAIATYSNSKTYGRALTKSQVEAEMASKLVSDPAGLLEYNDLIGQDLAAIFTADTGTAPWNTMGSVDAAGATGAFPQRSTDEPQWAAASLGWVSLIEQPYGDVTPGEWAPGFALGARKVTDGTAQTFRFTHAASSASAMLLAFRVPDWSASGSVTGAAAANLRTGIPLAAQRNVSGQVSAALRTAPLLAAGATGRVTGSAALTTEIRLAGALQAAVAGAANPTFPNRTLLNAEGSVTAAAAAGLDTQLLLRATAIGRVTGSANLSKPIELAAEGFVESDAIASTETLVPGVMRASISTRHLVFTVH